MEKKKVVYFPLNRLTIPDWNIHNNPCIPYFKIRERVYKHYVEKVKELIALGYEVRFYAWIGHLEYYYNMICCEQYVTRSFGIEEPVVMTDRSMESRFLYKIAPENEEDIVICSDAETALALEIECGQTVVFIETEWNKPSQPLRHTVTNMGHALDIIKTGLI